MIVSTAGSAWTLIRWQSHNVVIYAAAGAVPAGVHVALGWHGWVLPVVPLSIVGAALGIFVSFRTNAAYDRWWEGRKLWGRMINSSRMFCSQVVSYLGPDHPAVPTLVHRHIAYVHAFRCVLRAQDPFEDEEVLARLSADQVASLRGRSNVAHTLLQAQLDDLTALNAQGVLNDFRLASVDLTVAHLLDIQGGCERIKATPLPRGYAFIAEQLVLYFAVLFPWAVVEELGLLVIPFNVLVCLSFMLINEVGRVLEDPFSTYYNGLPLSAISRMIEVNLREVLHEPDLPPLRKPHEGILM